jgi:hypothetical protein
VPVELSPIAVERALARLGEHDLEAPRDVEGALEMIVGGEDDDAPLEISRYDLQLFLWYQLPCKLIAPLEVKQAVAERLARFLELVGEGAEAYADLCTSEQTLAMLRAWDAEDPSAGEQLREALEASGLEPPDTEALRWRSMMGFEEASLRDLVARELELWIDGEGIDPRGRGFRRRQQAFVVGFLQRPRADLDGFTPVDVIAEERLEDWASGWSEARREIVAPILPMLREPPAREGSPGDDDLMAPLAWLLEQGAEGIGLTQTGALNRALVRAFVERFPDSWRGETWGPPNREDDVAELCELHDLARRARLLRKTGRRVVLTKRGASLLADRLALRDTTAPHLLDAEGFAGAVQELAVAALLGGGPTFDFDQLLERIHAVIVADGWHAGGEAPDVLDVRSCTWGVIRPAQALGLLVHEYEWDRETLRSRDELTVSPEGHETLRLALRARAGG